ncbi:MAG: DNA translocase FtsK [Candidatus Dependentiae bacterium]|nr:DNA translocase FtsK [Candidatus Dependentiae bacterium]
MARRLLWALRMGLGLLCILAACITCLVLITFDPRDPSFFHEIASRDPVAIATFGGWWGASGAVLLLWSCGLIAFLLVPLFCLIGCHLWRCNWADWTRLVGMLMVFVATLSIAGSVTIDSTVGGYLGQMLYRAALSMLEPPFLLLAAGLLLAVGLIAIIRFSWAIHLHRALVAVLQMLGATQLFGAFCAAACWLQRFCVGQLQRVTALLRSGLGRMGSQAAHDSADDEQLWDGAWLLETEQPSAFIPTSIIEVSEPDAAATDAYELPLEKLFGRRDGASTDTEQPLPQSARTAATALETKLRQFGIEGRMVSIAAGPTVTLFSYAPATDVKLSRIAALEDDLALAIEARSLRVIAPMPGTGYVGIEVANRAAQPIDFAGMVSRPTFREGSSLLPLVLGKSCTGDDRVIDLTNQPHLLIAGSTGSGKSVALHTMIAGLLASRSPDELRLVMVDPKRLEFAVYRDLAHLLVPVVTEGAVACQVLRFLTEVMEERYSLMAQAAVRNIQEFHRVRSSAEMQTCALPIYELADLMVVAGKELDGPLMRLAQMARASGIHLIVATQRPSVDVLTGLVKVNFPARIAFKVASKTDARTILDQSGAERLLGRGDMLLLDPRGTLERIQGAFVQDDEIRDIIAFIKKQRSTDYVSLPSEAAREQGGELDSMFPDVVAFVRTVDEISISLIQRRFRIGYNRAARLVDQLESKGFLLPSQGGKMRRVAHDPSVA